MTVETDAAPPTSSPKKNPIGVAGFVVGAVIPLFQLITVVATTQLSTDVVSVFAVVGVVKGVVAGVLGVAAVTLGVIGLVLRDRPRGFAAAGTALGASALLGVFGSLLAAALFSVGSALPA